MNYGNSCLIFRKISLCHVQASLFWIVSDMNLNLHARVVYIELEQHIVDLVQTLGSGSILSKD